MDSHSQEYIVHIIYIYLHIHIHSLSIVHEIKFKDLGVYIFFRTIRTPKLRPEQWPHVVVDLSGELSAYLTKHRSGFNSVIGRLKGVPNIFVEKMWKKGQICFLILLVSYFFWLVSKITWWEELQNRGCLIPLKPWFSMAMPSTTLRRRSLLGWYKQESFVGLTEFFTCIKGAQDITIYT